MKPRLCAGMAPLPSELAKSGQEHGVPDHILIKYLEGIDTHVEQLEKGRWLNQKLIAGLRWSLRNGTGLREFSDEAAEITTLVQTGGLPSLTAEYTHVVVYVVFISTILLALSGWQRIMAYEFGALLSICEGRIGMRIAVFTHMRAAYTCWKVLASTALTSRASLGWAEW